MIPTTIYAPQIHYSTLLAIIFEISLLAITNILQCILMYIHRHVERLTACSNYGNIDGSSKSMTNGNYYFRRLHRLDHRLDHRLHPSIIQSCLNYALNSAWMVPWLWTLPPHSYFVDKYLSASNNGWTKASKIKFRNVKFRTSCPITGSIKTPPTTSKNKKNNNKNQYKQNYNHYNQQTRPIQQISIPQLRPRSTI